MERGLYFDLGSEAEIAEEMSEKLDLWIHVSTQHKGRCKVILVIDQ